MGTIICRDIEGNEKEFDASELTFRPSIYGVAIKDGAVLVLPQWDGVDFPGGRVELGEPILDALVREVKEETGLDTRPGALLHLQDSFFVHPKYDKPYHSILMYYAVTAVGGTISTEGLEEWERSVSGGAARWVPIEEAKKLKFYNSIDSVALIEKAQQL